MELFALSDLVWVYRDTTAAGLTTPVATTSTVQAHAQLLAPHELSPTFSAGQQRVFRSPRFSRLAHSNVALYRQVLAVGRGAVPPFQPEPAPRFSCPR